MGNANPAASGVRACCSWKEPGKRALWILAVLILLLDRASKTAVASWMPLGDSERVLDGFFNLVHARNTGIAFSLFSDSAPWFRDFVLPAFSILAIVVIVAIFRKFEELPGMSRLALALILAGAAGNLYDRLLYGYVTDFLDFHVASYHWPAFNVADSAITTGAILLLLDSFRGRHPVNQAARTL